MKILSAISINPPRTGIILEHRSGTGIILKHHSGSERETPSWAPFHDDLNDWNATDLEDTQQEEDQIQKVSVALRQGSSRRRYSTRLSTPRLLCSEHYLL